MVRLYLSTLALVCGWYVRGNPLSGVTRPPGMSRRRVVTSHGAPPYWYVVQRDPAVGGAAAGGAREVRRTRGVGGADEVGHGRNGDGGPACERRCGPAKGRAWPRRRPRGPSGRGRRARQATTDRAPRGSCSALREERSVPLVCNHRSGGLYMHGGNYLHWLVTALVKSLSENWARAMVSTLLGRRATTVGGTVATRK